MVARLLRRIEVDLGIPTASQLLDGGDIDRAVMEVFIKGRQVARDESAIDVDGVAGL